MVSKIIYSVSIYTDGSSIEFKEKGTKKDVGMLILLGLTSPDLQWFFRDDSISPRSLEGGKVCAAGDANPEPYGGKASILPLS